MTEATTAKTEATTTRRRRAMATVAATLAVASLLAACTDDPSPAGAGAGGGASGRSVDDGATFIPDGIEARNVVAEGIEWKPGVVQVPKGSFREALASLSADERTFTFSKGIDGLSGAAAGTAAVIEGVGILVVASTRPQGDGFVMEADPGDLTDALQNGRLEFDATVSLDQGARISTAKRTDLAPVTPDPAPADQVEYTGERDGGAVAPDGGEPATGPAEGSDDPLTSQGARGAPGPGMTTVPPPSAPQTREVVPPPNPDLDSPAYGDSATTTTTAASDGTDATVAPAAARSSTGSAPALIRTSAQAPAQAIDPGPSSGGNDPTIGAAGKGNGENPDALPPTGPGRGLLPEPPADALTGCKGPVCAVFGSAKSFDYVIDVDSGAGTTRLNWQAALKNESVGQIWTGGHAVIDRFDIHFAAEINEGTLRDQAVTARDMKFSGVVEFGARFSRTEKSAESFLKLVHDRAGSVIKDDLGFRLESPDLMDLTTAGEAAVAIQKLSNFYRDKWAELQKKTTAAGGAIIKMIGADTDFLAGTDIVKVPLRIQIPVKAGPLTVSVSFGIDFAVVSAFSTNNSSASGRIEFEGGGGAGIEATEGNVNATSEKASIAATWSNKPWAIQGVGSQGFSLTISAPRIGVGTAIIGPIRGEAYLTAKHTVTQLTPGTIMPLTACSLSKVWTSIEVGLVRGKDDDLVAKKELMKRGRWFQSPSGPLCDQQVGP